jgi:hypothetical protein
MTDELDNLIDWIADDFRLTQDEKEMLKAGALQIKNLLNPRKQYNDRYYAIVPWSNPECTFANLSLLSEAYCDGDMQAWLIPLNGDDANA